MRTRNDSNDNVIEDNVFDKTGYYAQYSEWFCDADCVERNPGHLREGASHGNKFFNNDIGSGYDGDVGLWRLTPPSQDNTGGTGCTNEGQRRLRTSGNT